MRLIDADKLLESMNKRYDEKEKIVPNTLAEGFMQVDKLINQQDVFDLSKHDSELIKAKEEVIKQYKWERDLAISQLEEIGASFGLNMKLWLKEHDSELLDKVYTELEKYKREINLANTPWNFIELVFSKMKAEVSE